MKSMVFPQKPHFTPGYTGHCPKYRSMQDQQGQAHQFCVDPTYVLVAANDEESQENKLNFTEIDYVMACERDFGYALPTPPIPEQFLIHLNYETRQKPSCDLAASIVNYQQEVKNELLEKKMPKGLRKPQESRPSKTNANKDQGCTRKVVKTRDKFEFHKNHGNQDKSMGIATCRSQPEYEKFRKNKQEFFIIHQTNSRLVPKYAGHVPGSAFSQIPPKRHVLTVSGVATKQREYTKKELLGYSMIQMYEVVADVVNYHKFVPYVTKSHVHSSKGREFKADLIVGFPPFKQQYTSLVTLNEPFRVQSVSKEAQLFDHLYNDWRFSPGLKDIPRSCVLDFHVSFSFKSLLYSQIANLFFDLLCDQMEHAFIREAERRFGGPSIRSHILSSSRS